MLVQTAQGVKDVSVSDVSPENYIVPKGEEHLYHTTIEVVKFNQNTGKRINIPRVQKFGKKGFESAGIHDNLKKQGYTVTILHDPSEWERKNKELAQKQQEQNALQVAENANKLAEQKAEEQKQKELAEQKRIDDIVKKALETQAEQLAKNNEKLINDGITKALASQSKASKSEVKEEKPASDAKQK